MSRSQRLYSTHQLVKSQIKLAQMRTQEPGLCSGAVKEGQDGITVLATNTAQSLDGGNCNP
jgi:hypothetical protein